MSTENNVDCQIAEGDDQQKAEEACSAFFGFSPALCAQNVYKRCREHGCKSEIKRCKNRAVAIWRIFWRSGVVQAILFVIEVLIVGGAVAYCLLRWRNGNMAPNDVIATFTVAMAYTTLRAWIAMHTQNTIMLKQADQTDKMIAHAQSASRQTDEIIEQMRFEQRAWLTIMDVHIDTIQRDQPIKCTVKVFNTGSTPGKIVQGTIFLTVRPANSFDGQLIELFEEMGFRQNDEFIVPPNKEVTIVVTDLAALSEAEYLAVQAHTSRLHVLCRFRYIDVLDRPHHIKGHYTLDLKDRGLYLRNNYGSMD